jgi:hypothetical protein
MFRFIFSEKVDVINCATGPKQKHVRTCCSMVPDNRMNSFDLCVVQIYRRH